MAHDCSTARTFGLLYDARSAYDLKVLAGIATYLREHPRLSVSLHDSPMRSARSSQMAGAANGFIADLNDPAIARAVRGARLPVVGFGGGWGELRSRVPSFLANNVHIADLAADHLLARGFLRFAFCGYPDAEATGWSVERERAFVRRVGGGGFPAATFRASRSDLADGRALQFLKDWLMGLQKPVGIMAANDVLGRLLLEACRVQNLRVPDEVAVIGVDNDPLQCELSHPPLSSIEQGARRVGYAAAMLLDQMLAGAPASARQYLVNPTSVIIRQSSDCTVVGDPEVSSALRFIADHVGEGLRVRDVVGALHVSRWLLESRFRKVLHSSVAAAIRQAQLRRVRGLVSETNLPLKQVASLGGFRSVQHMTTAFSRAFGQPPAQYRGGVAQRGTGHRSG